MGEGKWYHGGAPGLAVGEVIYTAEELGLQFDYKKPHLSGTYRYDPMKVYLTSHLGTALGYAARYCNRLGQLEPGDVYVVEPADPPVVDPDYVGTADTDISVMCSRAKIVEVSKRRVSLSKREQNRLAWPHSGWGSHTKPMYTEDGTMIASDQMLSNGVDPAYMALLPKWIDISEINAAGQVGTTGAKMSVATVLSSFDHLELVRTDHKVDRRRRDDLFECSCGTTFSDKRSAASHKVDESALRLIAEHNLPPEVSADPVGLLIHTIAQRSPGRWRWYLQS